MYESSELNTFGYKLRTVSRLCGHGGGIALVHKDFLKCKNLKSGTIKHMEYEPETNSCVTDFLTLCEDLVSVYENIIFLGDFNLHSEEDHAFQDFTISLDAMGLHQHVAFSTHEKGNTLDFCITEKVGLLSGVDCCPGPFLSDPRIVNIVFTFTKSNITKTCRISEL